MKSTKLFLSIILLILCQLAFGQQSTNPWEKWTYLIGEWVGEHNGQPEQGEGKFSFQTDLNGNILVRKSHTIIPKNEKSAEIIHDDLLIIYQPAENGTQEAIYFDNEGHTIKYKVTFTDKTIALTSDIDPGAPRFRFTYMAIDAKSVNASFEIASQKTPEDFKMYLTGKAFKVK